MTIGEAGAGAGVEVGVGRGVVRGAVVTVRDMDIPAMASSPYLPKITIMKAEAEDGEEGEEEEGVGGEVVPTLMEAEYQEHFGKM